MEVSGDAGSNTLEFEQAPDPVKIESVKYQRQSNGNQAQKPPPQPHWRKYSEAYRRGSCANDAVRVDRTHEEFVTARGQPVGYAALLRWGIPIGIESLELILIMQDLAGSETEANEIYLQLILRGGQIRHKQIGLAERPHELARAGDLQTANQNWRRGHGRFVLGRYEV